MARIMAIDYGKKRIGIAVTDPLQIIATGLQTVDNKDLMDFLESYIQEEELEKIVFGYPIHKDGNPTNLALEIDKIIKRLKTKYPHISFEKADESFTSQKAKEIILQSGTRKKKRRDKSIVDKISAVVILQEYLGHI